jgi:8-oxo-dGTP pyrophosphatase MutT (NUDIX family)
MTPTQTIEPTTPAGAADLTRDFTVAVFVVAGGRVLLHWHRKLGMWLPPGGHIEPHELPDEAARRETLEETGVDIRLVGGRGLDRDGPGEPRQLVRPAGIQLEDITPGHQHIDLVYFAVPAGSTDPATPLPEGAGWFDAAALTDLPLTDEVRAWCHKALHALADASTVTS